MYACIDLGSNSFHLLIGEWVDGKILIIERCSEKVQLGEGVPATGVISPEAFQRGLNCLQGFEALMAQHGVRRYWALGTNTFRIADNAGDFIRAAASIGLEISIISGVQEAVLIYAGVLSGMADPEGTHLIIDIGGGSTELIVGSGHQRLITQTLPVGCVSWRDRFFTTQMQASPEELENCLVEASKTSRSVFQSVAPGINHYQWSAAHGSSGTAKMLASVCHEHGGPLGVISLEILSELRNGVLNSIFSGEPLPGLKEKRRDLLLPGYAIMEGLMHALSCDQIIFSPTALREGMLEFIVSRGDSVHLLDPSILPDVSYAGS